MQLVQATTLLSTACLQTPDDMQCWFHLAGALARRGRQDAACLYFFRAMRLAESQLDDAMVRISSLSMQYNETLPTSNPLTVSPFSSSM